MKKKNSRQKLLVAVRVIVSTALLAYLLSTVQLDELVAVWSDIVLPFVLLAIGLQLVGVVISALKWWLLLRASGHHVPYRWAVRAYFIGQFFNNFLPTMIGGDAIRVYQLRQRITLTSVAIASVFVERLTGFVALSLIASVGLGLSAEVFADAPELFWVAFWCILVAYGGLVLAIFAAPIARLFTRLHLPNLLNWREKLSSIAHSLAGYYSYRGTLLLALLISFAYQLVWIGSNYAVALALGLLDVPFSFMALMVPISDIIGLVPIFLNNLGAREGTFVFLLEQLGVLRAEALALAFMIFIVRMVVSLVGGGLYLLGGFAGAQSAVTVEDLPGISSVNKG
jgi:hypothetical protein